MTIRETPFAAIDFESARLTDRSDAPIQVGVAWMENGDIIPESFLRSWIRPPAHVARPLGDYVLPDQSELAAAPTPPELWSELNVRLGNRVLIGHGAGTERRFLGMYPLHGFGPWVDSLQLARSIYPDLTGHSLGELITHFSLAEALTKWCPDLAWHDALYDAVASLLLVHQLITSANLWDRPAEWLQNPSQQRYYAGRRK